MQILLQSDFEHISTLTSAAACRLSKGTDANAPLPGRTEPGQSRTVLKRKSRLRPAN